MKQAGCRYVKETLTSQIEQKAVEKKTSSPASVSTPYRQLTTLRTPVSAWHPIPCTDELRLQHVGSHTHLKWKRQRRIGLHSSTDYSLSSLIWLCFRLSKTEKMDSQFQFHLASSINRLNDVGVWCFSICPFHIFHISYQ